MVLEATCGISNYAADPQASKSTYKAMHMMATEQVKSQKTNSNKNNMKKQVDVWGPIFKDRQNFVQMHLH